MKVFATKRGFIGGELKKIGEQFECSQDEFSDVWMSEDIKDITPPAKQTEKKKNISAMEMEYEPLEIPSLMEKEAKKKEAKKKAAKKKAAKKKAAKKKKTTLKAK